MQNEENEKPMHCVLCYVCVLCLCVVVVVVGCVCVLCCVVSFCDMKGMDFHCDFCMGVPTNLKDSPIIETVIFSEERMLAFEIKSENEFSITLVLGHLPRSIFFGFLRDFI